MNTTQPARPVIGAHYRAIPCTPTMFVTTIIAMLAIAIGAIALTAYWQARIVTDTYHKGWDDGFARGQANAAPVKIEDRLLPTPAPNKRDLPKG